MLEDEISKVNSMRIFDFIVEDETLEGTSFNFLCICAELKGQKGVLYIYRIVKLLSYKGKQQHKEELSL